MATGRWKFADEVLGFACDVPGFVSVQLLLSEQTQCSDEPFVVFEGDDRLGEALEVFEQ